MIFSYSFMQYKASLYRAFISPFSENTSFSRFGRLYVLRCLPTTPLLNEMSSASPRKPLQPTLNGRNMPESSNESNINYYCLVSAPIPLIKLISADTASCVFEHFEIYIAAHESVCEKRIWFRIFILAYYLFHVINDAFCLYMFLKRISHISAGIYFRADVIRLIYFRYIKIDMPFARSDIFSHCRPEAIACIKRSSPPLVTSATPHESVMRNAHGKAAWPPRSNAHGRHWRWRAIIIAFMPSDKFRIIIRWDVYISRIISAFRIVGILLIDFIEENAATSSSTPQYSVEMHRLYASI